MHLFFRYLQDFSDTSVDSDGVTIGPDFWLANRSGAKVSALGERLDYDLIEEGGRCKRWPKLSIDYDVKPGLLQSRSTEKRSTNWVNKTSQYRYRAVFLDALA